MFNCDIEEIGKILCLFPQSECLHKDAQSCISKICAETEDDSYNQKYKVFQQEEGKIINQLKNSIGYIIDTCKQNDCQNCVINKWCNSFRNNMQSEELTRKGYTYVDFFCGAGGLSLGFLQEEYKLSLANDIQECCIDTYALNHSDTPQKHIIAGDINDVIAQIEKNRRYTETDVVIGGPPCQGFSMANRQRIIDDPRNHLYKSYISAIKILNPKWIVMENVRGMLNVENQIREDFEAIGYTASAHILNAKNFGVPQNRERVIFIGNRLRFDNEAVFEKIFAMAAHMEERTLDDAIFGLRELQAKTIPNHTEKEDDLSGHTISLRREFEKENGYIRQINNGVNSFLQFNHKARYNNARDIEIFRRMNPGDNSADPKIADIMPYKRREKIFKDKYFKLEPNKPCKTITAHMKFDCNMYIHPYQARGLTPREAARVQSYPDDYYFRGAYTKTYMQIGNSVPPLMSRAIAKVIKEFLKEGEKNGSF